MILINVKKINIFLLFFLAFHSGWVYNIKVFKRDRNLCARRSVAQGIQRSTYVRRFAFFSERNRADFPVDYVRVCIDPFEVVGRTFLKDCKRRLL